MFQEEQRREFFTVLYAPPGKIIFTLNTKFEQTISMTTMIILIKTSDSIVCWDVEKMFIGRSIPSGAKDPCLPGSMKP